ncbi:Glutamyl-tRNA reductase [Pirellulimonas nuda]|uniref:Glutamyl-tRNA reductase n=1 Tax=Pirellulimonas nuda TaxID=2528009 RepID=A0A518D795_9BACT|nr:glutamyl-tRNA reductase [Pirellulimonas nuda]QDU87358.1 Glutamyl-tRNA reductase [Pirellulimonas nuda]
MKLRMVGCSHHGADASVRERLAFSRDEASALLADWRTHHPGIEAVLLSTCNRVELYAASPHSELPPCTRLLTRRLADARHASVEEVGRQLVTLKDEQAVSHLFRVASSLDSMVLGEPQITSQVRQAYELATELGSAGPLSHDCFQAALRTAKRVASETQVHRYRISIASVAISDFGKQIFERFDDKRVLVIGAGEMADETLRYLTDAGARRPAIVNRNPQHAGELAAAWGGEARPWDALFDELVRADIVVSTTGASRPIVSLDAFRNRVAPGRKQRPLFVLDLAIPRDFDPAIGDQLGAYLYSIDDLQQACARNRQQRERELPAAERIVAEEQQRFFAEARHRVSAPVIARLRAGLEAPKQTELQRLFNKLPELDQRQREEVQRFADRLVNKMLHPPMESLRDESQGGSPHGLLAALSRLFQLRD